MGLKQFVFDMNGVMSELDLGPAIKCNGLNAFLSKLLEEWQAPKHLRSAPVVVLGPRAKTYKLVKLSASANSKGFPWRISVGKKIVHVKGVAARVAKMTACSRPITALAYPTACCVQKSVWPQKRYSKKELRFIRKVLKEL